MNNVEQGVTEVILLACLKEEREKFESDKTIMQDLCDQLIELGVYPEISGYGYPALYMVEGWGVDWHEYQGRLECPHCKTDLRDQRGPPGKREIGIYDRDRDSTTHFMCPDCKGTFGWT